MEEIYIVTKVEFIKLSY